LAVRSIERYDEADGYYRRALELDPDALQFDPKYAWAHFDLANALRDAGRFEEALDHYRQVHAVNQTIPYVENIIRSDLVRQGRGEEVRREWKKALELDPPQHFRWFGYAELCLFLGDEAEYRRACQDLLRRFGNTSDPYVAEPTARAVLLAPPSEEVLRATLALADRAVAAEPTKVGWVYSYFLFAKGLAEYRSAVATVRRRLRAERREPLGRRPAAGRCKPAGARSSGISGASTTVQPPKTKEAADS
jgi:serine/threonine-protein kinase